MSRDQRRKAEEYYLPPPTADWNSSSRRQKPNWHHLYYVPGMRLGWGNEFEMLVAALELT